MDLAFPPATGNRLRRVDPSRSRLCSAFVTPSPSELHSFLKDWIAVFTENRLPGSLVSAIVLREPKRKFGGDGDRAPLSIQALPIAEHRGTSIDAKTKSQWAVFGCRASVQGNFFLLVCIDQVTFMESLVQPDRLRTCILLCAEEETRLGHLPPKSGSILEAVLYRGELPRAAAAGVVGTGERQARRVVSARIEKGVLVSDSTRAPLRLVFLAALASRWMPGLFPEKVAMSEQRDLRFPASDEKYVLDPGVVIFWGQDGETRVRCEISREALDDHFGEDGKEELEVFRSRPAVEQAARRKYLAGRTEADGSVLIRSSDL